VSEQERARQKQRIVSDLRAKNDKERTGEQVIRARPVKAALRGVA
jgi:hypothetical protein